MRTGNVSSEIGEPPKFSGKFRRTLVMNRKRAVNRDLVSRPTMPEIGNGIGGLAAVLKYAIEVKMWKEAMRISDPAQKPEKLTGIALHIHEIFQAKLNELAEIRELINTAKYQKRELLENLLQEQSFKVMLRSAQEDKGKTIDRLVQTEMYDVKKMFKEMKRQMNHMQHQINEIQQTQQHQKLFS